MRLRRGVDAFEETSDQIWVDAMLRDIYVRTDDVETIIHEYTLTAAVDAATGVIVDSYSRHGCCRGRNARARSPAPSTSSE